MASVSSDLCRSTNARASMKKAKDSSPSYTHISAQPLTSSNWHLHIDWLNMTVRFPAHNVQG